MSGQTTEEALMAQHLVQSLGLDHLQAEAIAPEAMLFGSAQDGVGLDSIDALEIALMIQQHYGVEIRSDDNAVKTAFASLRTLTAYVLQRRGSLQG
ncbi:MAG: acyl carrier protein [Candidatus Obscuribacterales bacterium]|nr:acyl carrier protein [Steroidobacteraceae bacterium]